MYVAPALVRYPHTTVTMAHPAGVPRPKKPKVPRDAVTRHLADTASWAERDLQFVMSRVRYGQFIDLDPPLPLDAFLKLLNYVMLRRFFSFTKEKLAERLGIPYPDIVALESHVHYKVIDDAVVESAKSLASLKSIDDIAQDTALRAGQELALTATAGGVRERLAAVNALADRVSPKRSRAGDTNAKGPVIHFPPNTVELMQLTFRMVGERQAAQLEATVERPTDSGGEGGAASPPALLPGDPAADTTIDAEVLNVPKQRVVGQSGV